MEFEIIRLFLVIVGSAIAAYTDWKTGMIYDWITYPLIAAGIILNIIEGNYFGIILGIGIFAFGYGLYWLGKIGGGDVKLFSGLAALLPIYGEQIFVLNVILIASFLAAIIIPSYYIVKYWIAGIEWKENKKGIQKAIIIGIIVTSYFISLYYIGFSELEWTIRMAGITGIILIFVAFENGIKNKFFKKSIQLNQLGEDEIIANEELAKEMGMKEKRILGKQEIEKLKEKGLSSVEIYVGLPKFGPFILIGVLSALYYPDLLLSFLIPM